VLAGLSRKELAERAGLYTSSACSETTDSRGIVQVPGESLRVKAASFKSVLRKTPKFQQLLLRYTLALSQVAQSAACNRVHSVDERWRR
jgi:hypothetical protein